MERGPVEHTFLFLAQAIESYHKANIQNARERAFSTPESIAENSVHVSH